MQEREKIIVSGLVTLLLLIWFGFAFHSDPSFAGSGWGLIFGISGTLLMFVPLLYLVIKRIKPLKKAVTRHMSMRTMLAVHIYAGVIGPVLVVIHSGHKFESPLGIALIAMTLIVVLSGFVGRYLMSVIGREIREKKEMLEELKADYDIAAGRLEGAGRSNLLRDAGPVRATALRLFAPLFQKIADPVEIEVVRLADAIADVEYAMRTHQTFKRAFSKWLKLHILISVVLYLLIVLHIFAEWYYGLRWLE